jgi:hypothetical protein
VRLVVDVALEIAEDVHATVVGTVVVAAGRTLEANYNQRDASGAASKKAVLVVVVEVDSYAVAAGDGAAALDAVVGLGWADMEKLALQLLTADLVLVVAVVHAYLLVSAASLIGVPVAALEHFLPVLKWPTAVKKFWLSLFGVPAAVLGH